MTRMAPMSAYADRVFGQTYCLKVLVQGEIAPLAVFTILSGADPPLGFASPRHVLCVCMCLLPTLFQGGDNLSLKISYHHDNLVF